MTEMQVQQALKQTVLALQGSGGRVYLAPQNLDTVAQLFVSGEQPVLLSQDNQKIPIEKHSDWQAWLKNTVQNSAIQPWAIANFDTDLLPLDLEQAFNPDPN